MKIYVTGTLAIIAATASTHLSAKPMRLECVSNDREYFAERVEKTTYYEEYASIPRDVPFIKKYIWEFDPEKMKPDGELEGTVKKECAFFEDCDAEKWKSIIGAKLTPRHFSWGSWLISRENLQGHWDQGGDAKDNEITCKIIQIDTNNAF